MRRQLATVGISWRYEAGSKRPRFGGGSVDVIEVAEGTEKSKGHHFAHPDPERVADFVEKNSAVTTAVE